MTRRDAGSIMPLVLGCAVLALLLVFVTANATGLYVAQRRLDAVADAAALASSDLADVPDEAKDAAARLVKYAPGVGLQTVEVTGESARVRVISRWHPLVVSMFVPDGVVLRAEAEVRVPPET